MGAVHRELKLEEEVMFGLRPKPEPAVKRPPPVLVAPATPVGLAGVREQAQRNPRHCFDALFHYVDVDLLEFAYRQLKEEGVRGGSGQTWTEYGRNLRPNVVRLYTRLQRGRHRTLPSWRRVVAVAQGQRRPLKRAALKDRIVQRAVAEVLQAVYGTDFLRFACGAGPGRAPGDALERFAARIGAEKPQWVVDVELTGLGASLGAKAMVRCLEHRIGDQRLLALIADWVQAGVMEDLVPGNDAGPPRSAIAALLAHVYCHYAFDLWAERWCERHVRSAVILARDAGRLIAAFRHKPGARRFLTDLRARGKQWAPALPARHLRLVGMRRYAREHLEGRVRVSA